MALFTVQPQSASQEFERLWEHLLEMQFLKDNGYKPVWPDSPRFAPVIEAAPDLEQFDKTELQNFIESSIYDVDFFTPGITAIETARPIIEQGLIKLSNLADPWDYKLFDTYHILLTSYGTNGSYDTDSGQIVIRVDKEGMGSTFHGHDAVVLHEIIHLGIESSIVLKYQLSHWEKEHTVDLITKFLLGDIVAKYYMQPQGDNRLDEFVKKESLDTLPQHIEDYIKKYPR